MKYFAKLLLLMSLSLSAEALKVGVTAGPHADIIKKVSEIASQQGLSIEVIEFNDFILPNAALASGDLDANSYQHVPFLEDQIKTRGYAIKAIAKTILLPLGLYSLKIKSLEDLPEGARIALPNDPTNSGRALKLLESRAIIGLAREECPSLLDIVSNPRKLDFVEIEAPLMPRSLHDVEAAVINTDWVLVSGMNPDTAILQENPDSPYVNVLVVRIEDEMKEDLQKLVKIYLSPEIRNFIRETYQGAVIPAW